MKRPSSLLLGLALLMWLLPAMAADTVTYYYTDALHSAVVETNAQGQVLETTNYAPYGQVLNQPLQDGPGYTGHEEDPGTGLVYMQQRYYDPVAGRFLSVDPVAVPADGGGFNRYWYANDNPYRYVDPDGMQSSACDNLDCPEPSSPKPQSKPKTLPMIEVTAHAIPLSHGVPYGGLQELPGLSATLDLIGALSRKIPPLLIFVPGNLGPSDCSDGRCGMMSEMGEKAPTDAPQGTLPLNKAKGKFGLSKDDVHKINDNATGGMAGGKTWVGVAPNREVGTSDNGKWVPQGTIDELKH